ncbi:hypothetical protein ACO1O0_004888 [Amphichorda felina]
MAASKTQRGLASSFSGDHLNFFVLLLTTPASIFLLYCSVNQVRYSGPFFTFIVSNRPSVQFSVQIIANMFAVAQDFVLCRLINFAVRRRLVRRGMELDTLRLWTDAMVPRINWELPWQLCLPLLLFVSATMALRGIWAAALTPVELWTMVDDRVPIPSWDNTTYIHEYPSEIGKQGATLQNHKGRFSYSVGLQHLGSLLASASSASPTDGKPREHRKMDNSRYTYIGRSYGVGAAAGLVDSAMEDDALALAYSYQEDGYDTDVRCVYNTTSDFRIEETSEQWVYAVKGELPDTDVGPEYSNYLGYDGSNIVAIGVAMFSDSNAPDLPLRRYLAFATGRSYDFLDRVQCEVDFVPTRFNITVDMRGRNVTVQPTTGGPPVKDIDPSRRLKGTVMRQFELIANDETNIYVSMVGTALNASVTDLRTRMVAQGSITMDVREADIVLEAVANSVRVMADDMLGAYAAAQLMVGGFKKSVSSTTRMSAIAIGEMEFAVGVFVINAVIIVAFVVEVVRTKWWRGMPKFDLADMRQVAAGASQGGSGLGGLAMGRMRKNVGGIMVRYDGQPGGKYALVAGEEEEEVEEKTPIISMAPDFHRVEGTHVPRWNERNPGGFI